MKPHQVCHTESSHGQSKTLRPDVRWPYFGDIKVSRSVEEHGEGSLEEENNECTCNQAIAIRGANVVSLQGGFDAHACRTSNETSSDERGPFDFIHEKHCHDVKNKPSELKPALEVQNLNSVEAKTFPDDGSIVCND